jgi:hypothetical protein
MLIVDSRLVSNVGSLGARARLQTRDNPVLRNLGVLRCPQLKVCRMSSSFRTLSVIVFRYSAKLAFDDAVEEGQEPKLLSTDDWEVALAYAEGDF